MASTRFLPPDKGGKNITDKNIENLLEDLQENLRDQIKHGILVSKLSFAVAGQMGLTRKQCHDMAVAGLTHDIGKLRLAEYVISENRNSLQVEEMKYVRMHSRLSYDILKEGGYSDFVLESVLYHHENFDGTGYPDNKAGTDIPIGARILRVCDVYTAYISDRPYRGGFDAEQVVELMIDEIKNFDLKVFMAFQTVVHQKNAQYTEINTESIEFIRDEIIHYINKAG